MMNASHQSPVIKDEGKGLTLVMHNGKHLVIAQHGPDSFSVCGMTPNAKYDLRHVSLSEVFRVLTTM